MVFGGSIYFFKVLTRNYGRLRKRECAAAFSLRIETSTNESGGPESQSPRGRVNSIFSDMELNMNNHQT
jgi:hypothetical protein